MILITPLGQVGQSALYDCSCIRCGYRSETAGHCIDFRCPVCGGQMRRADRPGPGQERGFSLGQYTQAALDKQYQRWRSSQAPATRSWAQRRAAAARQVPRLTSKPPAMAVPAAPPIIDPVAAQRTAAAAEDTSRKLSMMLSPVASRGSSRALLARRRAAQWKLEAERRAALTALTRQAAIYRVPFQEAATRVYGEDPAQMSYHALVASRLAPRVPVKTQAAVLTPIPAPVMTTPAPALMPPLAPPGAPSELEDRLLEARARLGIR